MPRRDDEGKAVKDQERALRRAARAHFRSVPPYCIRPELEGDFTLRRKRYEFWGDPDPAAATHWDVLSRHRDFEEAERKLRLIASAPVYYDKRGRLASSPALPEDNWRVPDDDG